MLVAEAQAIAILLREVPGVSATVRDPSVEPVGVVDAWLAACVARLTPFSTPGLSELSIIRTRMHSANEAPQAVGRGGERRSVRGRRAALAALESGELLIRSRAATIAEVLDRCRARVEQLVALAASRGPIPLPEDGAPSDALWACLAEGEASRPLAVLVQVEVRPHDRAWIVEDVIARLLAPHPAWRTRPG